MARIMDRSEVSTLWREHGATQLLPAPRIVEATAHPYFIDFEVLRRGVTIGVPPFAGSRPGLTVQAGLISSAFRYDAEGQVEDPSRELRIPVPADAALRFEGRILQVGYGYTDDEGSGSSALRSYHARFDIEPLLVDEAVGGTIPVGAVAAGVTLRIRPYASMAEGDRIVVYVVGSHAKGSAIAYLAVEAPDIGMDITHRVDGAVVQANQGGEVCFILEVQRRSGVRLSMPLVLAVEAAMGAVEPTYAVPGEHRLPLLPLTYEGSGCVPVAVPLGLQALAGDRVTLLLLGNGLNSSAVVRTIVMEPAYNLRLCIPYASLLANLDSTVRVGCLLEREGGLLDSTVTAFQVVENTIPPIP